MRNYKKENENYKSKPAQIHARVERNKARRIMEKAGKVHKGDGKQVDHIKPLSQGGKTTMSNLRVLSASENDSYPRDKHAHMKTNLQPIKLPKTPFRHRSQPGDGGGGGNIPDKNTDKKKS